MDTDGLIQRRFSRPHAWSFACSLDVHGPLGSTLAHLEYERRTILVDGSPVDMLCIAWVCTDADVEGCGLMTALLRAAHQTGKGACIPFAGLFADIPRFYERVGYRPAPNLGQWGMVAELSESRWDQSATVDLQGDLW